MEDHQDGRSDHKEGDEGQVHVQDRQLNRVLGPTLIAADELIFNALSLDPLLRASCNEFWCSRTKVVPGRMLGAPAGPRAFEPAMGAAGGPRSSLETAASVETTRAGKSPCSRI